MNVTRILILGGYGVFGGRLAELLSDLAEVELVIAGRDLARAEAFCAKYVGQARVMPLRLDRAEIADSLRTERPNLVVDASGPFQDYGEHRYGVIEACIAAGVDYVDFADAADFVFGVTALDERAKAAGVFVLSGVSSFPVLTAAVLREMARTMDIVAVEGGIAPSPYAGIGLNVMRAVVGYAGAPVKLWRDGKPGQGVGLAESLRFTVAVPGRLPLRNIHFSLVDVPDLQVIPREHPAMTDIWMGAGPVPEILHRILNLLAKARHRWRSPSLVPMSRVFYGVLNRMRFGEHRGGMFVSARGVADGKAVTRSWHLLAEGDDGPYIPSMAIEAIVHKLLAGDRPWPGARPATRALELADYETLFAGRSIYTGFRGDEPFAPLYRQILGSAFDALPPRLKELHGSSARRRWSGQAGVRSWERPVGPTHPDACGISAGRGECACHRDVYAGRWRGTLGAELRRQGFLVAPVARNGQGRASAGRALRRCFVRPRACARWRTAFPGPAAMVVAGCSDARLSAAKRYEFRVRGGWSLSF
jgi:hypothetical protein